MITEQEFFAHAPCKEYFQGRVLPGASGSDAQSQRHVGSGWNDFEKGRSDKGRISIVVLPKGPGLATALDRSRSDSFRAIPDRSTPAPKLPR
jgi:hypothetical protein